MADDDVSQESVSSTPTPPPESEPAPERTSQPPISEEVPAPLARDPGAAAGVPVSTVQPTTTSSSPTVPAIADLPARGLAARRAREQAKLDKLLAFVREKGSVENDDVQKLLRISDATASRYVSKLVKNGSLVRTGTPTHARYTMPGAISS